MTAMGVRRLSHRTVAKKFLDLVLSMLAVAGTCGAADVFLLNDGNLNAFDGKTSPSVFAGPKDAATKGPYHHLFYWKQTAGTKRFLVSKGRDAHYRSDSDVPSGVDLWLRDGNVCERQIQKGVGSSDCHVSARSIHPHHQRGISHPIPPGPARVLVCRGGTGFRGPYRQLEMSQAEGHYL
jgi:hypothetical protein